MPGAAQSGSPFRVVGIRTELVWQYMMCVYVCLYLHAGWTKADKHVHVRVGEPYMAEAACLVPHHAPNVVYVWRSRVIPAGCDCGKLAICANLTIHVVISQLLTAHRPRWLTLGHHRGLVECFSIPRLSNAGWVAHSNGWMACHGVLRAARCGFWPASFACQ